MPHIIIEHSEDLPVLPQVLVEKIHNAAFQSNLFDLETIKTRAMNRPVFARDSIT